MSEDFQEYFVDDDFNDIEDNEELFFSDDVLDEVGAFELVEADQSEDFSDEEDRPQQQSKPQSQPEQQPELQPEQQPEQQPEPQPELVAMEHIMLSMQEEYANEEQLLLFNTQPVAGPSDLVDDGQYGGFDVAQEGEVNPDEVNNDEWLPTVRIGDRANAAFRGRGRGNPCGVWDARWGACIHIHGGCGRQGVLGCVEWIRGDEWYNVCPTDDDLPPEVRERFVQVEQEKAAVGNWVDVEDASADVMEDFHKFCADENASKFQWEHMHTFQGVKEQFLVERTGPNRIFAIGYEAFRAIWDATTIGFIVNQTNTYAAALSSINREFLANWYDTNEEEILLLMAFWMLLDIFQMPSINACFSSDSYLQAKIFSNLFTRRRYWMLNRVLRFAPYQTFAQNPDKLRHIRPIVEMLNDKFKQLYTLSQDLCIDESLTLCKGNASLRQYIKTKASKYGVKMFELCESSTGYLWSFFVYTRTDAEVGTYALNKTVGTVLRLVRPLLKKGYRLFMDNWFNSPLLAWFLKRNKTDCVGTLRRNRKHIPLVVERVKLRRGSYIARHAGDVMVVSLYDRNQLMVISTHHGTEQIRTVARDGHPSEYQFAAVAEYNANMGGVDKNDQMLEPNIIERKRSQHWFKKIFFRLLNASIINSSILVEQSSLEGNGHPVSQLRFRLELAKALAMIHGGGVPLLRMRAPTAVGANQLFPPNRLLGRAETFHYPKRIETDGSRTGGQSRSSKKKTRCVWCTRREHRDSRTVYKCSVCEVPLCFDKGCFVKYHTER